jgi:hypothetical protein
MERETPVELQKSLEVVENFKKAGIGFVCVPILSESDRHDLIRQSISRLSTIAKAEE